MKRYGRHVGVAVVLALVVAATALAFSPVRTGGSSSGVAREGVVQCANLIYGRGKSSVCFSDEFLAQIQKDTNIRTNRRFFSVKLKSSELYNYPFSVMTGEGSFSLTAAQRENLRNYLNRGGFLVASAGCSRSSLDASFRAEMRTIFPHLKLKRLPMSHPIFHTLYDITSLKTKRASKPFLEGLEIDGKIVLVYSHEGLNDTANAGPGCCCCGGNEIKNARKINANLLVYALTH